MLIDQTQIQHAQEKSLGHCKSDNKAVIRLKKKFFPIIPFKQWYNSLAFRYDLLSLQHDNFMFVDFTAHVIYSWNISCWYFKHFIEIQSKKKFLDMVVCNKSLCFRIQPVVIFNLVRMHYRRVQMNVY